MRILVVEDETALAAALRRGLEEELFAVDVVADGEEALWAARSGAYDLVILDLLLPRVSGMDVCRKLRREGAAVPILMLTARDSTRDVVGGLDAGANDYLTKPFAFEELLARVRALLRTTVVARASVVEVGDLRVDTKAHRVSRAGDEIELTAKEFQLLEYLAVHAGEVVSKDRLAGALWAHDCEPDSNAIEVYVAHLRRKIDRGRAPLLVTVRGAGYVLRESAA
jgi:DNA-binding response OmpR family regulator